MKTRLKSILNTPWLAGVVVLTCSSFLGVTSTQGQGLDDLFSRPGDAAFDEFPEDSQEESVAVPTGFENRRVPAAAPSRGPNSAADLTTASRPVRSPSDLRLVDQSGSQPRNALPSPMQLRQRRALAESRNRIARLEAEYWGLRPSLRPNWSANPTTSSRYPAVHTIYVPVYIRTR